MRLLITLVIAGLSLVGGLCAAEPMQVRYWDWTRTPKRDDYQFAVLRLALERTVPHFGSYALSRVAAEYSTLRSRREVSTGTRVNVQPGPWRVLSKNDPGDQRIPVMVPIMSGLLGYRVLLIRSEDAPFFAAIRHADELKAKVAGQGRGWAELGLYRRHGYQVMDSGNINTLIPMLASRRFDYLPLSVTEASSALALYPDLGRKLMVAPNLLISYPLPTIFYVSARHPELARRIETGLKLASRDGSLDAMTREFFGKEIASLASVTRHFTMDDPAVPRQLLVPLPQVRKAGNVAP